MGMEKVLEYRRQLTAIVEELTTIRETAETEERDLTDAEHTRVNKLDSDGMRIKAAHDLMIKTEELEVDVRSYETTTPDLDLGPKDKRFATMEKGGFGQMLHAVRQASIPGGAMDPRLRPEENRAILGSNETVPSEGGFLVQTDIAEQLFLLVHSMGAVSSRTSTVEIGPNSNAWVRNAVDETDRANGSRWGGVQAYWADEGNAVTASKPTFRKMRTELDKLMAIWYATDEELQDAAVLQSVGTQAFTEEMMFKLEDAIIEGTGAGQPLGILNSNADISVAKEGGQAATSFVAENAITMRARLWARSRANSVWLINQDVEPQLHTMVIAVGAGGVPVYMPANGLSTSPFDTLYGRPVIPVEYASTLGTVGDVILADLSQYVVIRKGGVQQATSIHVQFLTDQTAFRFIMRVGGQPLWSSPLTPFKGTVTQSPFITVATRA